MTTIFSLSSSNFQLISTPFSQSFTTKTLCLSNPKPSKAPSFSLKDSTFPPKNNNDKQNDDKITTSKSEMTKMPTPPWVKGPIFIPNNEVLDLSKLKQSKRKGCNVESYKGDRSLTQKVSGRMGTKVMKKIVQSIERLKLGDDLGENTQEKLDDTQKNWGDFRGGFLIGDDKESKLDETQKKLDDTQKKLNNTQENWDDFGGVSLMNDVGGSKLDDFQKKLNDTQKNWDDFGGGFLINDVGGSKLNDTHKKLDDFGGGFLMGDVGESKLGSKRPWEKDEKLVFRRMKREKVVTNAELSLDEELLKRLRKEASKMRKWVKVKKIGVGQSVLDEVHSIWANNELVMFKFDLPLCRNMDRAREIVEIKTGGLVVWSKKDTLVAYRGCDYHSRRQSRKPYVRATGEGQRSSLIMDHKLDTKSYIGQRYESYKMDSEKGSLSPELMYKNIDRSLYEREGDRLLDGLGPRYIDWWYPKPLPVDGDLLPEVVPGFKPPFRVCPPRVRPQLTDDELTYLRNFARPLPVHFVLGRNSKLQGLAVAILKLWERSVIAKIAVKWGVPNTNNELMASELKEEFFCCVTSSSSFSIEAKTSYQEILQMW